ncbi:D-glycero-beta-D-manno-heptose-7-phosphate kinase [uncultured Brachyspira sp.]|uniref:D-glycero-beta-D-manno-heptose-7-phosphate kinase n=1 Tax=uncultured Brachyspira sp. TaxID=221953 RepID=UPI0025F74020|nr:D-glycero-beta-D-manno-heptose-7-phosphate kinase [uncultured Brachyspira sp.]
MDLKDKAQTIINAKVLVIGDLMLDRFTYGDVIRISPEAPVPVLHVNNEENYLGGAGNVARNTASLIGNNNDNIFIIGVIGQDKSADIIMDSLNYYNITSKGIIIDESRSTITKTRIVAGTQQIVRIDEEDTSPFSSSIVKKIEKAFIDNVDNYNVVIISDYAKGIITRSFAKKIIDICNKKNKPVLIDPAIKHFSFYKKATLMTPNLKEAAEGSESKFPFYEFDEKAIKVLGDSIIKKLSLSKLMITLGANGMALFDKDIKSKNSPYIIPTKAKSVFDVSGAGDTVISVLAMCLSVGLSFKESSEIANAAAGIVVGKRGTSTLTLKELINTL